MPNFKIINTHKVFEINVGNKDYQLSGFEELFKNEEKYFWFIARKEFIKKYMEKHISKDSKIMEVGAGTGNVTRFLIKNGYKNISVGEMHLDALDYAKSYGIEERYCFNILNTPFENEFDCICAFDVVEHIEDDKLCIQNIHKMLKKEGKLAISVPAFNFLWSRHDVDLGHKRRYTKKTMKSLLENNGFKITEMKYFFISIIPLLYLRAILNPPPRDLDYIPIGDNIQKINPIINQILNVILKVENKLIPYLPNLFGGSLFVIAKKI